MRILTNSPFSVKGLISIREATDDAPQKVFFCIPLDNYEANTIRNLNDFNRFFKRGVTTKVKESDITKTIDLELHSKASFFNIGKSSLPHFTAKIKGHSIDFHLSQLNFLDYNILNRLSFEFYYEGRISNDLFNKRFVILEPNWKQLDRLFIEDRVLFTDWA
ncbi:MAG TPA: hypothetical protein VK492_00340 [Chitinophagaceae bacterium]|nr:hypothetical protein [Chitinophagaceae bacterium]